MIDPLAACLRDRMARYPNLAARALPELKELGYSGRYTAVADFLRNVRPAEAKRG